MRFDFDWQAFFRKPESLGFGLLGVVIVGALGVGLWLYFKRRPTPGELECRRRESIHRTGKISDGEVVEMEELYIVYSYTVGGVGYLASQDLSALEGYLPENRMSIVGPVCLKHDPRNPANSIVLSEQWNGLRHMQRSARALG